MCSVDHVAFASPGYLIDTPMKSFAPGGALFTRLLAHHAEVGLRTDQVMQLLALSREYHDKQVALRIEFAKVTEQLEIKWGRVDEAAVAARQDLLDRHAALFRTDENLFIEYARRGHELLTDEQIEAAEAVYHAEKNASLTKLATSLDNAVAPAFTFRTLINAPSGPRQPAEATSAA